MRKSLLTISIILTGFVFSFAAQSKLKTFPRPESAEQISGLEKAACVALDSEAKICQGLTEEAASGAKFVVWRGGEIVGEWESEVFLGETADYKVFRADLDADRNDELIVANRNAVSSGMSVNYWTIAILPFPVNAETLNPAQFQTEDFSSGAAFVPRRKDGGFDIMATQWQTLPVNKAGSRTALYFVGRWFVYQNGEFETSTRPVLVRRYLTTFERERLKDIDGGGNSFPWLNSKTTEKRAAEPLSELIIKSETNATIESVVFDKKTEDKAENYKITLKTQTGEKLTLIYSGDSGDTNQTVDFIGSFDRKRLYPKGYVPKDLAAGKAVKLIVYAASKIDPISSRVLWLTN